MTTEGFPHELLTQPAEARLAYFAGKVVAHPRLGEAHRALLKAIHQPSGAPLILVFGPTGVGKTTLRLGVERQLIREAMAELEKDLGRIPVVAVEAVAPESGQFNWKDYYTRALMAMEEPLIGRKIDYGARRVHGDGAGRLVVEQANSAPELRRALEQCLRHRRPAAFIVDEAQHLKKVAGGRRLLDQMDTLKSLSAMTGTVHVLVGTYELLSLAGLSAQLSRRSAEIHFGRYRPELAEDMLAFRSMILTFQRHLPLAAEPDLVRHWEYLYEHSVGCVGVLKNWLNRALAVALEEAEPTLTWRHLEGQADSTRKLLSLAREIREGEERLRAEGWEDDELRRLLGLGPKPVERTEAEMTKAPPPGTGTRRPVGRAAQRWPERDPVGNGRTGIGS